MPITITHISEAYRFDELTDAAKEKARDWYRECRYNDPSDFDSVIDDFVTIAEMIGVSFATHEVHLMNGKSRWEPKIWWSGFCSQGDGACFEGTYDYKADAVLKVRGYCSDEEIIRIAEQLAKLQCENAFGLHADIERTSSNYAHENTVSVCVYDRRNEERELEGDGDAITHLMKDLMRWLYGQLDEQNDYLYSAECVDESITANEYMFDEEGNRHDYA